MLKLRRNDIDKVMVNKGFTLIEVLCSITVFSLLFMTALFIQLDTVKVKKYNEGVSSCTLIMEYVKNNIIYNFSREDILDLYKNGRIYINCNEIKFEDIEEIEAGNLFSDVKPMKEPYIVLNVMENNVLKINLQLYRKTYGKIKVDECEFYKGNYKK
ncbi:type II secretion system protein [Clostridium sp. Mt-5]|uniref:Type II secretion system protein n=1 Tax=Clostridium moutaii TaxID=3240932 RepID=A0ABV4BKW0_9CLOT